MQRAGILLLLCGCAAAEVLTIREAARLAQHAAHATRAGSPHQHLRGGQHAAAPRARSGGRVSSCPTSLNTTTWSERRRAQPRVSYRDATPADMVVGKADSLVAQDSNMKWWPITITARNADGNTWTAAVMDGTGEQQWDSVWPQFVRVKVVSPPLTEFEDVRLSACSAFDPQCASHLHPAGLRGMDADCAEHLPHAAWSGFNADQGRQIPPAALAALPAGACQMLSAGVAEGVACERVRFSEDCARSLSTPALEMLSPLCISRIPAPAFATYDGDQVSSLLKGLGSGGLQPGQIRGLSTDGCLTIGNDWGAVRDLGFIYGARPPLRPRGAGGRRVPGPGGLMLGDHRQAAAPDRGHTDPLSHAAARGRRRPAGLPRQHTAGRGGQGLVRPRPPGPREHERGGARCCAPRCLRQLPRHRRSRGAVSAVPARIGGRPARGGEDGAPRRGGARWGLDQFVNRKCVQKPCGASRAGGRAVCAIREWC
eukprot:TRINITY_DN2447_c0_g1_i2.p1 TRINITY_DN2447_c0_g1~~TRINITY_DN2447_c0_g1_i2.p1  ORF type:complete len:509 (+),score=72.78 TRINITY_DN2447_c0_g1_i2:78-1529(+)